MGRTIYFSNRQTMEKNFVPPTRLFFHVICVFSLEPCLLIVEFIMGITMKKIVQQSRGVANGGKKCQGDDETTEKRTSIICTKNIIIYSDNKLCFLK